MNIGYGPGIFTLDFAPGQVGLAGIAVDTLHIGFHRNILDIWSIYRQDTNQDLIPDVKPLIGITQPVPGKIPGKGGAFYTEDLHAYHPFGHGNHPGLDDAILAHAGVFGISKGFVICYGIGTVD